VNRQRLKPVSIKPSGGTVETVPYKADGTVQQAAE
jgi:hypothetical protein